MQKMKYILITLVIISIFSVIGCQKTNVIQPNTDGLLLAVIEDAENIKWFFTDKFVTESFEFSGASNQSNVHSFSGEYSCEVNKKNEFGLGISLDNIPIGSYAEISVWRYSAEGFGALHVSSSQVGDLYFLETKPLIIQDDGWEKIVLNICIEQEVDRLKIACYNPNDSSVYFDDLSIKIYESRPVYYNVKTALSIHVNDSSFKELLQFREKSLAQKVITPDLKKYVKGFIQYKGEKIPVKLRFKGDWTDHLQGDKWSFRIKVGAGYAINGLKSFSIQSPKTRGFLKEWFLHKVFENIGLLTTSYDFIPVMLNGKNLGMYALEEHFDKQLIESRERREGPILKMDEEGFWESNLLGFTNKVWHKIPYYEAAALLPFKKKRTLKSEGLRTQFLLAKDLVYQYKTNAAPIQDLFELDALAAYHALLDLGGVDHGQAWHNQRWYYNPITSKLVPIAYDLYTDDVRPPVRPAILGMVTNDAEVIPQNRFINESVFNQQAFQIRYLHFLKEFATEQFLNTQIELLQAELDSLNQCLGKEFSDYKLDLKPFYANAKNIEVELPNYAQQIAADQLDFVKSSAAYDELTHSSVYYSETGLKAYKKAYNGGVSTIECINFHTGELTIIGYGIKQNKHHLIPLIAPIKMKGFAVSEEKITLTGNGKLYNLFFTVPAFPDSIFTKKIVPWPYPGLDNPRRELEKPLVKNTKLYSIKGPHVTLNKNVHLTDVLFIPVGYELIIHPGSTIKLSANGGLLSYSPVTAIGTKSSPIKIQGMSSSNNGIQVLTKDRTNSKFEYVTFSKLSSFSYKGWTLTGGLTVYKGNVAFNQCTFKNNTCEDAVNLVNCSFTMTNTLIENTFSDGFDADFCVGTIDEMTINKAGNDGLDFSGSVIKMSNIHIFSPGDKAISGGEKSTITVNRGEITKAKLGIVAKDLSVITVSEVGFSYCENVFACFQKKEEYGPAKIVANQCRKVKCGSIYLLGKGCSIMEDGVTSSNLNIESIDSLYSQ
jgi:hypothetical protein